MCSSSIDWENIIQKYVLQKTRISTLQIILDNSIAHFGKKLEHEFWWMKRIIKTYICLSLSTFETHFLFILGEEFSEMLIWSDSGLKHFWGRTLTRILLVEPVPVVVCWWHGREGIHLNHTRTYTNSTTCWLKIYSAIPALFCLSCLIYECILTLKHHSPMISVMDMLLCCVFCAGTSLFSWQ